MNTQDRKLILGKLDLLRRYRNELAPLLKDARPRFEKNVVHVRAVERLFQVMVECAIDANRIIIEARD